MATREIISGIYKIQSKTKHEKFYIGSSKDIVNRWSRHRYSLKVQKHKNPKLQMHYNKYGLEDLSITVVCKCDLSELIKQEQYFIDTLNPWFNVSKNAERVRAGIKHTDETKLKISKSHKGKKLSYKRVMPRQTEEAKEKKSKALKGRVSGMKGKHHTEETKKKISNSNKGKNTWSKTKSLSFDTIKKMRGKIPWNKGLPRELNPRTGIKQSFETLFRKQEMVALNAYIKRLEEKKNDS